MGHIIKKIAPILAGAVVDIVAPEIGLPAEFATLAGTGAGALTGGLTGKHGLTSALLGGLEGFGGAELAGGLFGGAAAGSAAEAGAGAATAGAAADTGLAAGAAGDFAAGTAGDLAAGTAGLTGSVGAVTPEAFAATEASLPATGLAGGTAGLTSTLGSEAAPLSLASSTDLASAIGTGASDLSVGGAANLGNLSTGLGLSGATAAGATGLAAAAPAAATGGGLLGGLSLGGVAQDLLPALPLLYIASQTQKLPYQGQTTGIGNTLTAADQSLIASGQQLTQPMSTGTLPAGAEANLNQALNSAKASVRSQYASMGLSGSTMEAEALAGLTQNAVAERFNLAQQMAQTGLSEITAAQSGLGTAASLYQGLMQKQLQQDTLMGAAIANFSGALAANSNG